VERKEIQDGGSLNTFTETTHALEGLIKTFLKLREQRENLLEVLQDVREFLDGQIDVVDGDYGEPAPNKAMRLAQRIDEALGEVEKVQ
jgi:hypothetical protein